MAIVITLSLDVESFLHHKAIERGQDINVVASELLETVLAWEIKERQDAIAGIQQGLDDFASGHHRSFEVFREEQSKNYNLLGL